MSVVWWVSAPVELTVMVFCSAVQIYLSQHLEPKVKEGPLTRVNGIYLSWGCHTQKIAKLRVHPIKNNRY